MKPLGFTSIMREKWLQSFAQMGGLGVNERSGELLLCMIVETTMLNSIDDIHCSVRSAPARFFIWSRQHTSVQTKKNRKNKHPHTFMSIFVPSIASVSLTVILSSLIIFSLSSPIFTTTQGLNLNIAQQHGSASPKLNNQDLMFCSFNIQVFGKTKMSKADVVNVLLKILSECHVTFVMEVRDSTGSAIVDLLDKLNQYTNNTRSYRLQVSERLGRTSSKEQYGKFFNFKFQINNYFFKHLFMIP